MVANIFEERLRGREATRFCDGCTFFERLKCGLWAIGDCVDLADGAAKETGDEAERGDHDPLVPHGLCDVGGEFGVEAGVAECGIKSLNAGGDRTAAFAVDEFLHGGDLHDAALVVEVGGDQADAAEKGLLAKGVAEGFHWRMPFSTG